MSVFNNFFNKKNDSNLNQNNPSDNQFNRNDYQQHQNYPQQPSSPPIRNDVYNNQSSFLDETASYQMALVNNMQQDRTPINQYQNNHDPRFNNYQNQNLNNQNFDQKIGSYYQTPSINNNPYHGPNNNVYNEPYQGHFNQNSFNSNVNNVPYFPQPINQQHHTSNNYYQPNPQQPIPNSYMSYSNQPVNYNNFEQVQTSNQKSFFLTNGTSIPKEIRREISFEKNRIITKFTIGLVAFLVGVILSAIYIKTEIKITLKIPHPIFMIPIALIGFIMMIVSIIDFSFLRNSVKKYVAQLNIGREQIPFFITRNYRSLISRSIYVNWIAFPTYVIGAIVLAILYGIQAKHDQGANFQIGFWNWGEVKDVKSDITTLTIIIVMMLVLQISNILVTKMRKNNIISYYGYEILPSTEVNEIKRRANKICLIIFISIMAILLFVFVVIALILRKRSNKTWRWPWQKN